VSAKECVVSLIEDVWLVSSSQSEAVVRLKFDQKAVPEHENPKNLEIPEILKTPISPHP
jgi:hypothetical protein